MRRYIVRRLLQGVVILVVLSLLVFTLLRIAPYVGVGGGFPFMEFDSERSQNDPAVLRCGLNCGEGRLPAIVEQLGLNDPYFPISFDGGFPFIEFNGESQYGAWVQDLFSGSLGRDFNNGSVGAELKRRIPTTVELLIITTVVSGSLGIAFGVLSAVKRNSPADLGVRSGAVLGLAVPGFWVAVLVLYLPQVWWNYAPPLTHTINFFDDPVGNLKQFVPPGVVIGAVSAAGIMRLTRSSMLEVMRQDYVRTARSKGLRERIVITRHALKNSLIPVMTVIGLEIAGAFGGAVIAERIFNLNGVGQYFLDALIRDDFQVVQTLTLYVGLVVVLANLLVDIMYAWLDPRIRYS